MKNRELLSTFGLKWNPFSPNIPLEGIVETPQMEAFFWRIENLILEGGFGMISGPVGSGKSMTLRWLEYKLSLMKDIQVAALTRPQSSIIDIYRELGDLFGLALQVRNRYASYRMMRDKWIAHIDSTLFRPVLLIDEAQEMNPAVLSELRLLSSRNLDSQSIVTVILCGDERLRDKLKSPELIPLGSRIKNRLNTEGISRDDLIVILENAMRRAGNPNLMQPTLIATLADKSLGNFRVMMQMASELLEIAAKQEITLLDEALFFKVFAPQPKKKASK